MCKKTNLGPPVFLSAKEVGKTRIGGVVGRKFPGRGQGFFFFGQKISGKHTFTPVFNSKSQQKFQTNKREFSPSKKMVGVVVGFWV